MPLVVAIWNPPTVPPAAPSLTPPGQLRGPSIHVSGEQFVGVGLFSFEAGLPTLLVNALTDIRDQFTAGGASIVEVPQGSGRFYDVVMVEDVAKGFLNEHRMALISKRGIWPAPIP